MQWFLVVIMAAVLVLVGLGVAFATPEIEVNLERSPVEIDGVWYLLAADFIRITGSTGVWNSDEKSLTISFRKRSIAFVIGSAEAIVFADGKYQLAKLDRKVWLASDRVVIPVEVTCEVLGLIWGVEEDQGTMIIATGTESLLLPIEEQPRWAGVSLSGQVLILYAGDWELYRFRCSSGRGWHRGNSQRYPEVMWVVMIGGEGARSRTYNVATPYKWFLGERGDPLSYYNRILAIHGFTSVPNGPASAGCIRLSIEDARFIYENRLLPLGSPVQIRLSASDFTPWRELF